MNNTTPRPLEEWGEDYGDVLWWKFPIEEPPYVGSPLDADWPGYHTHWTSIPLPVLENDEMTKLEFTRSDEKATEILKAVRHIDNGVEIAPVVHGKWLEKKHEDGYSHFVLYHCSMCDCPNARQRFYCPECGAKMDL